MTLNEWVSEFGMSAKPFIPTNNETGRISGPPTGAMLISDAWSFTGRSKWLLHHLSDYVVSSVTGGTIWLSPR